MTPADIPLEEEALLARVLQVLSEHAQRAQASALSAAGPATQVTGGGPAARSRPRYDQELVSLRDDIGEARLEDVPQLVAQMERLQQVALTRADLQTILVDPASPYFGHLRLREQVRGRGLVERDVLIGRATFVDANNHVNIVDWRRAPVSQLFYRYSEGSDYEEHFGEREVEGEILARRTLTIEGGVLVRVASPLGIWVRRRGANGHIAREWERHDVPTYELAGGEQTSTAPSRIPRTPGVLGAAPAGVQALDRHLPEIAALIDKEQFELITAAGQRHRRDPGRRRLRQDHGRAAPRRVPELPGSAAVPGADTLFVVPSQALVRYVGGVLPSLGVAACRS